MEKKDKFYSKYLKYKSKYLNLKKQEGGMGYCDTTTEWKQFIFNVWKVTRRLLWNNYYIGCNRRRWYYDATVRQTERGSCNLWVWNELYPSPGYNRNHLDMFFVGDEWTNRIGVSIKRDNEQVGVEYFYIDIDQSLENIGYELADIADYVYRRYFPCLY